MVRGSVMNTSTLRVIDASYRRRREIRSRIWTLKSRRSSLDRIEGFVVTPLGNPRLRAPSISTRFALSTNIFTALLLLQPFSGLTQWTWDGPRSANHNDHASLGIGRAARLGACAMN